MKLPAFLIVEEKKSFETRIQRLIRRDFPMLSITLIEDYAASRYEIKEKDKLIAEIDTLPSGSELEINIAQLDDNVGFCESLLGMIESVYHINIPYQWVSVLVTKPVLGKFIDSANHTPDSQSINQIISDKSDERLIPIPTGDREGLSKEEKKEEAPKTTEEQKLTLHTGKGGRKTVPLEKKLEVINKWQNIDRHIFGTTLAEFLESEFGTSGGIPNVAESTFYGWRRSLRKK
jgi:hypothetical protein